MKKSYWKPRSLEVAHTYDGPSYKSYHPPYVAFDSSYVMHVFSALPRLKEARAIVRAARLYASAMERIESEPDIPYQLLISAVETMAAAALGGWEPDESRKLASKVGLVSYAMKSEKLPREAAERLGLEACRGNPWSGQKFKKFLLDHLDLEAIAQDDDLFIVPREMCPEGGAIEKAIAEIYRIRSGAIHSGFTYPASAAVGPSARVPVKAFDSRMNQEPTFPPIGWFERVVSHAFNAFLRSRLSEGEPPRRRVRP